jgi:hypothetical protein
MLAAFPRGEREHEQGTALLTADAMPKSTSLSILSKNQQVTLVNPLSAQGSQPALHEFATNASAAVTEVNGQMVYETPATVMTTQDCAHKLMRRKRNEAETRIAVEETGDSGQGVSIAEAHTVHLLPQVHGTRVVSNGKRTEGHAHWR